MVVNDSQTVGHNEYNSAPNFKLYYYTFRLYFISYPLKNVSVQRMEHLEENEGTVQLCEIYVHILRCTTDSGKVWE